ncbi:hypothetical protein Btru_067481 [Bulinus truncatus]|nr:hypothetical protein Btru_067481 [Bulinus truncatus]
MPIYQTTATPSQPQSAKAKNLSNNVNQTVNKNHTAQPTTTPQRKVASKPAALPVTVPKTSPSQRQTSAPSSRVQPQVGKTPSSLQGNNLLDTNNLIDLTDEDDVSNKAQKPVAQTTPKPAVAKNLLPSAANGYNTSLHVGAQDILYTASSNQVALNPVQNSQLIALPPLPTGSPFHLIPINNTVQTANKTPMYALLSGPRPALSIASPNTNTRPVVSTNMAPATNATTTKSTARTLPPSLLINNQHPAPLPSNPDAGNAPPTAKKRPPKPGLKISKVTQGIVLSWNMPSLNDVEKILSYQLFAYQETENSVAKYSLWKKVGDVKALPLPMACTLTQFQEGNRYHFAVRAVDQYERNTHQTSFLKKNDVRYNLLK